MNELITKEFGLKVEEVTDGHIEAYLTTFGNEDLVGDVVEAGALDNFIEKFDPSAKKLPMLLNHDRSAIVGEWNALEQDGKGVIGKGVIYTETTLGKDVQALLKRKAIQAVSIGFRSNSYKMLDNGGRSFKEIELIETSVVLAPANPKATVLSVKSADGLIETKALKQLLREGGMTRSEVDALFLHGWSGLKSLRQEEASSEAILETLKQFKL